MLFNDEIKPYKVENGFYIREQHPCNRQIGMQKLDSERIYIYKYNPVTGKHEGEWCSPKELLNIG